MNLKTIYERIRTATSDAEVQSLEVMLDRIIGAIYAAQTGTVDETAKALEELEQWKREENALKFR